MPERNVEFRTPEFNTKSVGQSSQSLRISSNTVTESSDINAPRATSFLQLTTLHLSSPTAQSWISPLQAIPPETDIDTPIVTWSGTHSTSSKKNDGITGYLKVDDELGSSGLIVQEQQSSRTLPFSLAEAGIVKTANDGPNLSQYAVSSVDSDHDFTGSTESVIYVPSGQATLHQPPEITSMKSSSSIEDFQSLSGQTSMGSFDKATFPGTLGAVSRSKPMEIGSYVTENLETSSHLIEHSRHYRPTQTTRNELKSDDLDMSTPNPITKSQLMDSTTAVPATTTATKNPVEELTMDGSRASRALSSHGVGLIVGSISGASLLFAISFYLHRFCFRRIGRSGRGTGSVTQPKADNPAATCPDMQEILEISRFSAYS